MLVEDLARVIMRDVSSLVRQAMVFELRRSKFLPKDIANKIARDMEDVAVPFMEATEIFSNRELAKLIPVIAEQTRISIARRPSVSEDVSMALVKIAGEKAVTHLIRNPGAKLSENAFSTILDRFNSRTRMMNQLSSRIDLPLIIVERLVDVVSSEYRVVLAKHYDISTIDVRKSSDRAKSISFGKFLKTTDVARIRSYVRDLKSAGELKPQLIMNMTRESSLRFFRIAMSELLNIPLENASELLDKGGDAGLEKLLRRALFPSIIIKPMTEIITSLQAQSHKAA